MNAMLDIPEIQGLDTHAGRVRIPPEIDVPLTPRVRQILDTPEFRRLSQISQLGLVGLVYPAANHSRLEHSLGVYYTALLYLKRLAHDERFAELVSVAEAERFLAATLVHDLGHWPFCHPMEDMRLPGVPSHELFANSFLLEGELADVLRDDWQIQPRDVVALLSEKPRDPASRLLAGMLSGPIDVDKMDYLARDSLHAGVPYGRNFDQRRLIASLCLNEAGDGLAISEKGRTAAEMMVFSRYVMFSEVYWHHAVRAATAMLQRAFFELHAVLDLDSLCRAAEGPFIQKLLHAAGDGPARDLCVGLFGPTRRLYKRVAQFSYFQGRSHYDQLARRPYDWLVACAEQLAAVASTELGRRIAPHEILIDAPPVKREIEFDVDVYFPKENCWRPLGEVSPVVHTLATRQFDDYVKQVRIFAPAELAAALRDSPRLKRLIEQALERME